jgi:hypothetical protein
LSFAPRGERAGRSSRPQGAGAANDNQTIVVRRALAAGAGVLVLLLLFFGIKGCLNSRKDSAFRTYAADVRALIRESDGLSDQLFQLLSKPGQADALDVQNEVNALSTDADQLVERAKNTHHPDELNKAQDWIVTTLEFRRDGLKRIAEKIPAAAAEKGRKPAITGIAAQMQAFLASDVIYSQRAVPELQHQFKKRSVGEQFSSSQFLPDLGWLEPTTVDSRLSQLGNLGKPATPGTHGTGLQGVTAKPSGTALVEGGVNRIAASNDLTFEVQVQNQGESEETNVDVTVSIKDGTPINIDQTISRIAAGDTQAVDIPITPTPATGAVSTVTVEVAAVPGEKVKDNNKATYQVVFTKG